MSENSKGQSWPGWVMEAIACTLSALGLTIALLIKHLVEKAIDTRWLNGDVFRYGLSAPKPATNGTASTNGNTSNTRPWPGAYKPTREAAGTTWAVSQRTGKQVRVPYDQIVRDRNGLELYEHSVDLSYYHVWNCPLLLIDKACTDCQYYINRGSYRYNESCAAVYKLQHCAEDPYATVESLVRQMENS